MWHAKFPRCCAGSDITLKKLTAFGGFKVLSSLYCHVFKEGIVPGFSFDPLQFSVGKVPWKNSQTFFQFAPIKGTKRLLRNSCIKDFQSSYILH